MKTDDPILEKIRALLRLSKSDNPHEAALAMQRAMEIAMKHQIELSGISADDDIHKLIGKHMELPSRLAKEWKEALNLAHAYFNVNITVIQRHGKCLIVGTELDIELAQYVITFLVRACRECLAKWKVEEARARRKTTGNKAATFIEGFFLGQWVKLRDQQAAAKTDNTGLSLMLSNGRTARDEFTRGHFKGPVTTLAMPEVRRDRRSLGQGFTHGQKTQINPGLRGNSSTLALT